MILTWVRTRDQLPPEGEYVLMWNEGGPYWKHGSYENDSWSVGCECFSSDPPDFWALVPLPDAAITADSISERTP